MRWKRYAVGKYRLQQFNGRACAVWIEDGLRKRFRISAKSGEPTENEARDLLTAFANRLRTE